MAFFPNVGVFLREVTVESCEFNPESFAIDQSAEGLNRVLSRLDPLDSLGEAYKGLLLPALPCFDIVSDNIGVKKTGYIKSNFGLEAIPSGRRSCIFKKDNKYIRLKGCGNLALEFNVELMAFPPENKEIRGCCFKHTVTREQYMTWLINQILVPFQFFTGNSPLEY